MMRQTLSRAVDAGLIHLTKRCPHTFSGGRRLRGTQGDDLSAHERTVYLIERQVPARLIVSALAEVPAQEGLSLVGIPARLEVRQQEGNFVGDVDVAQRGIELQAIECHQSIRPANYILGMQISVAFPDLPSAQASSDPALGCPESCFDRFSQPFDECGVTEYFCGADALPQVAQNDVAPGGRAADQASIC